MNPLPSIMCQVVEVSTPVDADPTTGAPATDEWGVPIDDPTPSGGGTGLTWTPLAGCSLQPMQGAPASESNGATFDQAIDSWRLFTPPGVVLRTTDRVRQGANPMQPTSDTNPVVLDLEVYGSPGPWPGPDGTAHHVEVTLKAYSGGH